MRKFRIFVGPASVILQINMLKSTAIVKICLIVYAIKNVPTKDETYLEKKSKHGTAMKMLFLITIIEFLKFHV